ncbi:histidine kinase [Methylobrevis albus]|uniref:histidine kinase n=1 Tax=Methylobrevis albus TaxID=2793297 RepID=A0A931I1U4_9HYPH|nr:histidine kinase [Methylobrevis albus]MBH0237874.1 hypothetical protein [Methylobrevis albus]
MAISGLDDADRHEARPAPALRRGMTFKRQVTIALVAFGVAVWALVAIGLVLNARIAVREEIESSFDIAALFLETRSRDAVGAPDIAAAAEALGLSGMSTRHVRKTLYDPSGAVFTAPDGTADAGEDDEAAPPTWFQRLLDGEHLRSEYPITLADGRIATLVLVSDSEDEIAEVWADFRFILPVTVAYSVVLLGAAILVLNHVFGRLRAVADGMQRLGDGGLDARLSDLHIPELAFIVERFNDLAERLGERDAENRHLNRRLLVIQDEERRRIAYDLHDELGPYLFGVRATTESLGRAIAALETAHIRHLREGLDSLADLTQSIQSRTRKLVSALRPMSLGEVPLAELVSDFVDTVGRFAPEAEIRLDARIGDASFGEAVDLTVFRFVQESLMNALRHGGARQIEIRLAEGPAENGRARLVARITDDGAGPPGDVPARPGYGLTGLAERVLALAGEWSPPRSTPAGTVTEIVLPIEHRAPVRAALSDGEPEETA